MIWRSIETISDWSTGIAALPMLSDACAWLDEQQQLVITVRGVEFTSHVPVTDQFAATIGCEGVVHLIVVSGVPIRADQSLHIADLHDAAIEGHLVGGVAKLGTPPNG